MLCACPRAAHAGWALHGPEKPLWGNEGCAWGNEGCAWKRARHRHLQPRRREIVGILGSQAVGVMLLECPCCKTRGRGVWPHGCRGHRGAPEVAGVKQPVPCLAWGDGGAVGSAGREGPREAPSPHPGDGSFSTRVPAGSCRGLAASRHGPGWHPRWEEESREHR